MAFISVDAGVSKGSLNSINSALTAEISKGVQTGVESAFKGINFDKLINFGDMAGGLVKGINDALGKANLSGLADSINAAVAKIDIGKHLNIGDSLNSTNTAIGQLASELANVRTAIEQMNTTFDNASKGSAQSIEQIVGNLRELYSLVEQINSKNFNIVNNLSYSGKGSGDSGIGVYRDQARELLTLLGNLQQQVQSIDTSAISKVSVAVKQSFVELENMDLSSLGKKLGNKSVASMQSLNDEMLKYRAALESIITASQAYDPNAVLPDTTAYEAATARVKEFEQQGRAVEQTFMEAAKATVAINDSANQTSQASQAMETVSKGTAESLNMINRSCQEISASFDTLKEKIKQAFDFSQITPGIKSLQDELKAVDASLESVIKKYVRLNSTARASAEERKQAAIQADVLKNAQTLTSNEYKAVGKAGFDTEELQAKLADIREKYDAWSRDVAAELARIKSEHKSASSDIISNLEAQGNAIRNDIRELERLKAAAAAASKATKTNTATSRVASESFYTAMENSAKKGMDSLDGKSYDAEKVAAIRREYEGLRADIDACRSSNATMESEAIQNLRARKDAIDLNIRKLREEKAEQDLAARNALKETNLTKQAIALKQQVTRYIETNSRASASFGTQLNNIVKSIGDGTNLTKEQLAELQLAFRRVKEDAHAAGLEGRTLGDVLGMAWQRFGGWTLATRSFMFVINKLKQMVTEVKEVDTAMTEFKKVTDLTAESYERFGNKAIATAKEIGASVTDVINSSADFARLGYEANEATELAKAALIYKNVADGIDNIDQATESITSTLKAFSDETTDAMSIVDRFNEVGNKFAINSAGIGEAMMRSASALKAAGNNLNESIGLVTAANAILQNPQAVGTGIKTLTMYLRAAKTELDKTGESSEGCASSVSKLRAELLGLTGVDITLNGDTFKSTTQILRELSGVWDDLTDITQARVTELIAGKRNANLVQAIMKNFGDVEEVIKVAGDAEGSAIEANEKYLESIEGHIARMKVAFTELANAFYSSDFLKAMVDMGRNGLNVITSMAKGIGSLPTAVGLATAALSLFTKQYKILNVVSVDGATKVMLFGHALDEFSAKAIFAAAKMKLFGFAAKAGIALLNAGVMTIATMGITFVINGITKAIDAVKEAREEEERRIKESNEAARDMNSTVEDAVSRYFDLSNALKAGEMGQQEYESSVKETIATLKDQGETVDSLIDKYGNLDKAMAGMAHRRAVEAFPGLKAALDDAEEGLSSLFDPTKRGEQNAIPTQFLVSTNKWSDEIENEANDIVEAIMNAGIEGVVANMNVIKGLFGEKKGVGIYADLGIAEYSIGEYGEALFSLPDDAESVLKAYDRLANILGVITELSQNGKNYTDNPFYQALYEEYSYMKPFVEEYEKVRNELDTNVITQHITDSITENGIPETQEEFEQFRQSLIDTVIADAKFVDATGGAQLAVEDMVDSMLDGESWSKGFSEGITNVSDAAVMASENITNVSDALKQMKEADAVLEKAQKEMRSGGGISADTLSSISKAIGEMGDISKYVYAENGVLKLNEDAWKEWGNSIANTQVEALEGQASRMEDFLKFAKTVPWTLYDMLDGVDSYGDKSAKALTAQIEKVFNAANVDLFNRKVLTGSDMFKAGWDEYFDEFDDSIVTLFSHTFGVGNGGDIPAELDENVVINITPIDKDGNILGSEQEIEDYIKGLLPGSENIQDILDKDKEENGGKGLIMGFTPVDGTDWDSAIKESERMAQWAHIMSDMVESMKANKDFNLMEQLYNMIAWGDYSPEGITDTLTDIYGLFYNIAEGMALGGDTTLLDSINALGVSIDDLIGQGDVEQNLSSILALIEVLRTAVSENPIDLSGMFTDISAVQKDVTTLNKALESLAKGELQDWGDLVAAYPELMDVSGLFDVNTVEGQQQVIHNLMQQYQDDYDAIIEKKIESIEASKAEAAARGEDVSGYDILIDNLQKLRHISLEDVTTGSNTDPFNLDKFAENLKNATGYASSLQKALESLNDEKKLSASDIAELVNANPDLLNYGDLLGADTIAEQKQIIEAALDGLGSKFAEYANGQIELFKGIRDQEGGTDVETYTFCNNMIKYYSGLIKSWKDMYGGVDPEDPTGFKKITSHMKEDLEDAKELFESYDDVNQGNMLSFKEVLDLYTKYGDNVDLAALMNAGSAAEQATVLNAAIENLSANYDAYITDAVSDLNALKNAEGVTEEEAASLDSAIAILTAHIGTFKNDAVEGATEALLEMDDAIGYINKSASFVSSLGDGKSTLFDQMESAKELVEQYNELTNESVKWQDLMLGIDSTTGEMKWDKEKIDRFTDAIINQMVAAQGLEEKFPGITAELLKLAHAEKEAEQNTTSLSDAFNAVKSVSKFLTDVKKGTEDSMTMIESAQSLADQLNKLHESDSEWQKVDWTHFLADPDTTNEIKFSAEALREVSDAYIDAYIQENKMTDLSPELIQSWKDKAAAEIDEANALQTLNNAISETNSAYELLNGLRNGSIKGVDAISRILSMAEKSKKYNIADLIVFDPNGVTVNQGAIEGYIEEVFNFDSLKDVPGMTEDIASGIQNMVKSEISATQATQRLNDAFSAMSTAKGFLSDIRSGNDDILSMMQTAIQMAEDSGQKLSNFFNFGFGDVRNKLGTQMWNTDAVYQYFEKYIDGLEGINGVAPSTVKYIKRVMRQQLAQVGVTERLSEVLSSSKRVMEQAVSPVGNQQVTYDQFQQLLEVSTAYAGAIEYNNGVMTLNKEKYDQVTEAVLKANKAEIEAAKAALVNSDRYRELAANVDHLTGTDLKEWMDMQANITGFTVLAEEIDNAASAYQRFLNADSAESGEQFSAAKQAADVIKNTLYDKSSALYGKIGREQFKEAVKFVISPDISINSKEFKAAWERVKKYTEEGGRGVKQFVDDLYNKGLVDKTTNKIDATVGEIAKKLGITEDFVRAMIEETNMYLDQPLKVGSNVEVDGASLSSAWATVQKYMQEGGKGIQAFINDLYNSGFLDQTTNQVKGSLDEIANHFGISVEYVQSMIDEANKYVAKPIVVDTEVNTDGLQNGQDAADNVGDAALTAEQRLQAMIKSVADLETELDSFAEKQIGLDTTAADEKLKGIMDKLTEIETKMAGLELDPSMMTNPEVETGIDTLHTTISDMYDKLKAISSTTINIDTKEAYEKISMFSQKFVELANRIWSLAKTGLQIGTTQAEKGLGRISSALSTILNKLEWIAQRGLIKVDIEQTTYKRTYDYGYQALAGGTRRNGRSAKKGQKGAPGGRTLVGEEGTEIVVDPKTNKWYTVGDSGAEFRYLPEGAIVFNAEQTRKLLRSGRINSRGASGISMLSGNAAASVVQRAGDISGSGKTSTTKKVAYRIYTYIVVRDGQYYYIRGNANHISKYFLTHKTAYIYEDYTGHTEAQAKARVRYLRDQEKKRKQQQQQLEKQRQQQLKQQQQQQKAKSTKTTTTTTTRVTTNAGGNDKVTGTLGPIRTGTYGQEKSSTKKSTSTKSSGGSSSGGSSSSSTKQKENPLDKVLNKYKKVDEQLEHLIEHQEILYDRADRNLVYNKMDAALRKEVEIYKKRIKNAKAGIKALKAKGATDNDKQLQELEEYAWESERQVWATLDKINSLYSDALHNQIDDMQTAYKQLTTASDEFVKSGHISVDTFQELLKHGIQYLDYLDIVNGKYIVNKQAIEDNIKAEKQQLAVETAMGYLQRVQEALSSSNNSNILSELANETQQIGTNVWNNVDSLLKSLKNKAKKLGIADSVMVTITENIKKLKLLAGDVVMEISEETTDGLKKQEQALDKLIDLTQDLVKAESQDRVNAIKKEIDLFHEMIDLKKESLDTSREEDAYQKEIAERLKEITTIQSRMDMLSLDDSRSAQAERAKLAEELAEAQETLREYQDDHSYDRQVDALDKLSESYDKSRQEEIDDLENQLSSAEKVYQAAIERINSSWDTLYQDLLTWNTEQGSVLNSEITDNWNKALASAQEYGDYISALQKVWEKLDAAGETNDTLKYRVEDLPKYHSGGVVGNKGSINAKEAVAVLEKGEIVLDQKKKNSLYQFINFKDALSERLGKFVGDVLMPLQQMAQSMPGNKAVAIAGGTTNQQVVFSPSMAVTVTYDGTADPASVKQFGETIAQSAIDKLYGAFEKRGTTNIFNGKLKG